MAELFPADKLFLIAGPCVLESDELHQQMVERTPLRRLGEVEDIALAALYLASPAASFVTGKIWEVDGGIEAPNLPLGLPDL